MDRWFFTIARPWGVPLRLHASLPLGMLLLTGFRVAPGAWLGIFTVVLLHEMGHAILVRLRRLPLVSIDVHGFGGMCRYGGHASSLDVAIIAWGGVLAQAVLFAVVVTLTRAVAIPPSAFGVDLIDALTRWNALILGLNLLPVRPLDGAEAWSLFRHLRLPRRSRRQPKKSSPAELDRKISDILRKAEEDAKQERLLH